MGIAVAQYRSKSNQGPLVQHICYVYDKLTSSTINPLYEVLTSAVYYYIWFYLPSADNNTKIFPMKHFACKANILGKSKNILLRRL